eukprot:3504543-Rhodomonas_salina.1
MASRSCWQRRSRARPELLSVLERGGWEQGRSTSGSVRCCSMTQGTAASVPFHKSGRGFVAIDLLLVPLVSRGRKELDSDVWSQRSRTHTAQEPQPHTLPDPSCARGRSAGQEPVGI